MVDFEIDPFCEEGPTIKCSRGEQSVIANIEAMSELMNFEADIDRLDAEMTEINYPEPPMAMTNIEQGRSPTTY